MLTEIQTRIVGPIHTSVDLDETIFVETQKQKSTKLNQIIQDYVSWSQRKDAPLYFLKQQGFFLNTCQTSRIRMHTLECIQLTKDLTNMSNLQFAHIDYEALGYGTVFLKYFTREALELSPTKEARIKLLLTENPTDILSIHCAYIDDKILQTITEKDIPVIACTDYRTKTHM